MSGVAAPPRESSRKEAPDRSRFGIKARLFLAFYALAALTAVASAVAWAVFADIARSVTRVTAESLPGMVSALSLAEKSAEISITAPALMASRNQEERAIEQARLSRRTDELASLIQRLGARRVSPEATVRLRELQGALAAKLGELDTEIEGRLDVTTERQARLAALSAVHEHFLAVLEPYVDDSVFDLVIKGEQVTTESKTAVTNLVERGVNRIDRLLTINAEANLAAGLLAEAGHVDDAVFLEPLHEQFESAAATVDRNLSQLPEEPKIAALREAAAALLGYGRGRRSIFERRRAELEQPGGVPRGNAKTAQPDVDAARERLLLVLTPLVDDAAFDLVLQTESVTKQGGEAITGLIDIGANVLNAALTLRAEGNLAAGLLNRAALAPEVSLLGPLRERFDAADRHIQRVLGDLPPKLEPEGLRRVAAQLLEIGKGDEGLFALRREELRRTARAQAALDQSRALTARLTKEVTRLVSAAHRESQTTADRSTGAIAGGKLVMIVLTAASVLGAALVMVYYVGPRIIRPLESITTAMTDLAAGDTSVDIPGRDRGDELGRMAQALGVFRDTAIEVQESNLREIREARRRLTDAIESISEAFSLYDPEDRLIICNSKYRSLLYPEFVEEIRPGTTFEATVRRAVELGYIRDASEDPEGWLSERLARHRDPAGPHVQQRRDGRWIMVSERKTEDGGTVAVYSDITELKQREQELGEKSKALEQLSSRLAKYLSPQVYESIFTGRQEVKVASRRKKLSVFFSDIAGFTETADRLESEELTQLLNHYLTEMSRIALDHGATIDKYVGDAIVIFFGDPESRGVKEDALACVEMAIAMRERMRELEGVWRDSGIENPLKCRIGINTGFCTVGNFGSEDRMDYTIIGSGVNLASRLETSAAPGEILISYETYALVKDHIHCEERGKISVKGIAYPVATYQVVDAHARLAQGSHRIREDRPNLKLALDPEAMSEGERTETAEILRRALDRIAGPSEPGAKKTKGS